MMIDGMLGSERGVYRAGRRLFLRDGARRDALWGSAVAGTFCRCKWYGRPVLSSGRRVCV